jgi:hypothetical protein
MWMRIKRNKILVGVVIEVGRKTKRQLKVEYEKCSELVIEIYIYWRRNIIDCNP